MTVSTGTLLMVTALTAGLVSAGLVLALRALVQRGREHGESRPGLVVGLAVTSMLLIIVGARLVVIAKYAVDIAYWDQWEEAGIYGAFQTGKITWASLLASHNEHRIFLSRVINLLINIANGQWDNRLEAVATIPLHAAAGLALFAFSARTGRKLEMAALAVIVILTFALPFARENAIWGYQSVFYMDLMLSIVGVGLAMEARPLSRSWFLALAVAGLAIVALGAGVLAPIAIAIVTAARALREREGRGRALAAAALAGAVAAVGVLAMRRPHDGSPMSAHGPIEFMISVGRTAAWPATGKPWLAPIMWLPVVIMTFRYLRSRDGDRVGDRVLLGLGAWVLMHAPAIAEFRGAGGAGPATRYMDILGAGVVINAAAAMALAARATTRRRQTLAYSAFGAWLLIVAVPGYRMMKWTLDAEFPAFAEVSKHQIENVRRFVATDDLRVLQDKPPLHVPYPVADPLAAILREPLIRRILPASVREPLRLEPERAGPFTWNALPPELIDPVRGGWSSFRKAGGGSYRSRPIDAAGLPYLSFECTGEPIGNGRFLGVVDAVGERSGVVRQASRIGGWRPWAVARRAGSVVAVDERAGSWLAFREPAEMGALSFWSERLLRHGERIAWAGAIVAGVGGLLGAAIALRRFGGRARARLGPEETQMTAQVDRVQAEGER